MGKKGKEITYEEFQKALNIVERYKYQQDKTVYASVIYNAEVSLTVKVPEDMSVEEVVEALKCGYYDYETYDRIDTKLISLQDLVLNGDEIDLRPYIRKDKIKNIVSE